MRKLFLPTSFLTILLSFYYCADLSCEIQDKANAIKHVHSGLKENRERNFLYIAGNPKTLLGSEIKNVEDKFELAALYASSFRAQRDTAIFLFYKDPEDKNFEERINKYIEKCNLKNFRFVRFQTKHEIVNFLIDPLLKEKIDGMLLFTHSYPFGINVGIKNTQEEFKTPMSNELKRKIMINDPQYLYIENLGTYLSQNQRIALKNNFTKKPKIFLGGCRTSFDTYIYKIAEIKDSKNYIKGIKFYSYAQRLANMFEGDVFGTQESTHFETSDDGGKTFRYPLKGERIEPGKPLLMLPDRGEYGFRTPIKTLYESKSEEIRLKYIPYPPTPPAEKYGDFYKTLDKTKKENLDKAYVQSLNSYKIELDKYNLDYAKLESSSKALYKKEFREREKILKKLLLREREYQLKKAISIEAIYWYRWHYGPMIKDLRLNLGLPPISMAFTTEEEKNPLFFLSGIQYLETENFKDYLDL